MFAEPWYRRVGSGAHLPTSRWLSEGDFGRSAEPQTTNNRMELFAALAALRALKRPCEVVLHTDSRYLRDAFEEDGSRNGRGTVGARRIARLSSTSTCGTTSLRLLVCTTYSGYGCAATAPTSKTIAVTNLRCRRERRCAGASKATTDDHAPAQRIRVAAVNST